MTDKTLVKVKDSDGNYRICYLDDVANALDRAMKHLEKEFKGMGGKVINSPHADENNH